jgi:hypothetical protein
MNNRRAVWFILLSIAAVSLAAYGVRSVHIAPSQNWLSEKSQERSQNTLSERAEDQMKADDGVRSVGPEQQSTLPAPPVTDSAAVSTRPHSAVKITRSHESPVKEPPGQPDEIESPEMNPWDEEMVTEALGVEELRSRADELNGRAAELKDKAEAYFDQAAELSEHGNEDESMELERRGLELETKSNSLVSRAAELNEKARDQTDLAIRSQRQP